MQPDPVSVVTGCDINKAVCRSTGSNAYFLMEICRFASPHEPCLDGKNELFFLSDCHRDVSTHLKTHGLSKSRKDINDEVDLLLCRAGKLISFF